MKLAGQLLLPLRPLPLVWNANGIPLLWALSHREPVIPHYHKICGPKGGGGGNITAGASSYGPSEAIAGPSGSSQLLAVLQGDLPSPAMSLNLHFLPGSLNQVNLKDSGKIDICEQCKKQTSNQDSMVSHCLQEHLGMCLVCPQCVMSYLDPSKFCLHIRGIHNLLFY